MSQQERNSEEAKPQPGRPALVVSEEAAASGNACTDKTHPCQCVACRKRWYRQEGREYRRTAAYAIAAIAAVAYFMIAHKQWKATNEATNRTTLTARTIERPWLFPHASLKPDNRLRWDLGWRNFGHGPAFVVKVGYGTGDDMILDCKPYAEAPIQFIVPPGEQLVILTDQPLNDDPPLEFSGSICYRDQFSEVHRTNYVFSRPTTPEAVTTLHLHQGGCYAD